MNDDEAPDWAIIEATCLGRGQKLQGLGTCDEVMSCLTSLNVSKEKFKLLRQIHAIARHGADPRLIFQDVWGAKKRRGGQGTIFSTSAS